VVFNHPIAAKLIIFIGVIWACFGLHCAADGGGRLRIMGKASVPQILRLA
jgi:hypothetical protein